MHVLAPANSSSMTPKHIASLNPAARNHHTSPSNVQCGRVECDAVESQDINDLRAEDDYVAQSPIRELCHRADLIDCKWGSQAPLLHVIRAPGDGGRGGAAGLAHPHLRRRHFGAESEGQSPQDCGRHGSLLRHWCLRWHGMHADSAAVPALKVDTHTHTHTAHNYNILYCHPRIDEDS